MRRTTPISRRSTPSSLRAQRRARSTLDPDRVPLMHEIGLRSNRSTLVLRRSTPISLAARLLSRSSLDSYLARRSTPNARDVLRRSRATLDADLFRRPLSPSLNALLRPRSTLDDDLARRSTPTPLDSDPARARLRLRSLRPRSSCARLRLRSIPTQPTQQLPTTAQPMHDMQPTRGPHATSSIPAPLPCKQRTTDAEPMCSQR